ncbi:hypothetical protein SAMN05216544_0898 [Lachnospira pectinoschiza]|uniref:Uncharacterized protein n=1 Tax=Lachnospira pectinoschiza TaxID=28052 RepID=A0A1G9VC07_9FIRM|nr:hypothetical protein SAMN05216544_0898 [Lachnospira pectinoschiza]
MNFKKDGITDDKKENFSKYYDGTFHESGTCYPEGGTNF